MYPPIVATAQPAFNYNSTVRVYFGLSAFDNSNGTEMPSQVQVVVKRQINNTNALINQQDVLYKTINSVSAADDPVIGSSLMHYYIQLSSSDIENGFLPNNIYKVQLRFFKTQVISEWSTVVLLKPIKAPSISIEGFPVVDDLNADSITNFYSIDPIFTGVYSPTDATSNETLKSWQMILYDKTGLVVLADSGVISASVYATNTTTPVECQLPYTMTDGQQYQVYFGIQTKNGYTAAIKRSLIAYSYASKEPSGTINLVINEEDGYAKVSSRIELGTAGSSLTLRRSSSESQFMIWEDIANKVFTDPSASWDYYDFTIKSGVFYQYAIQKRDSYGRRSQSKKTERMMGEFDSAFLVQKSESLDQAIQLKLRFDTSISSQLINISQTKTDTMGGRYPIIRRNGNMYYHSFPLSGLITTYMDNSSIFANEKELYDYEKDLYESAFGRHNLSVMSGQYNYTLQRQFREKVKAFLYNNKVKLFRSLTQGNMLVKLMDISLTPKEQLGRLVYSFSATAVEVDEPTIKNYNKYGIIYIGNYTPDIVWTDSVLGQLSLPYIDSSLQTPINVFPANYNLMDYIKRQQHFEVPYDGASVQDIGLSYLRIQIESDPYLVLNSEGTLSVYNGSSTTGKNLLYGTLVKIGDTNILIEYPNTIYEIKDDNVLFGQGTEISFPKETKASITYVANLSVQAITKTTAQTITQFNAIGQFLRTFTNSDKIWSLIWYRYFLDLYEASSLQITEKFYIKVNSIYELHIEADPGTVFYVKTTSGDKAERMQIDQSGVLRLSPWKQSSTIQDGYFAGICVDGRMLNNHIYDNTYSEAQLPTDISKIEEICQYSAYKDQQGVHIYHNGNWYAATRVEDKFAYDIDCPVEAMVNYYISVEKGVYGS